MYRSMFVTCVLVTSCTLPVTAQIITRTQDFAADPGWVTLNSGVEGNNFGYRTSSNAGGASGEAGGRFTRSNTFRYYADTSLAGPLSLNSPLSASGRFDYTIGSTPDFVNGVFIGHFRPASESYALGIFFSNGGTDPSKLAWGINVRGDGDNFLSTQTTIDANINRTWSYDWNPTGGAFGLGRLTATLSGPGGGTKSVDVPAGSLVRDAAHFEAFGLTGTNILATANVGQFADMFIDDVSYTAAVPEPASLTLMAGALVVAGGWRRFRGRAGRSA